ncbi:D,D-heptose 1,7-bisphosphate phosphatase, partial [Aliarcobacter butzleri]|nr:D,D-heptose 1,7-bisphosphate phosphatase [Aliarcobacter butzleri]
MQTNKKKIIYLDRDGVINKDFGYVYEIDKFEFINGVFEACKYFIN